MTPQAPRAIPADTTTPAERSEPPRPAPRRFAILGYGRFGRAFAELVVQAGHTVRVHDPHATVAAEYAAATAAEAVDQAEWVVLAMPVPHMRDALLALRPHLHPAHIVIDVGSVKMHPCALLDDVLGAQIPHAGTHPLFGPLSLARGERPLRVVVCPSGLHPAAGSHTASMLSQLGCEVITQDPPSHDQAMAQTHALAFFIAKGLLEMGVDDSITVAPPSFHGLSNMLSAVRGDAGHLFAAIQQENPYAAAARARLIAALQDIHQQLLGGADDAALAIQAPTEKHR